MTKLRQILLTATVIPAISLAQLGAGFAQSAPGAMRMAQAQPREEEHKAPPAARPPAPAPHAPAAPAAPRPAPQRAEESRPAPAPHVPAPRAEEPRPAAPAPRNEERRPAEPPHAPARAEETRPAPAPHVEERRPAEPPHGPARAEETRPAPHPVSPPPPAAAAHPVPPPPPAAAAHEPPRGAEQARPDQARPNQATPGQPGPAQAGGRPGAGAVAAGVAAGLAGGFIAGTAAHNLEEIHRDRHESHVDGVDIIREPGRTIVGEQGHEYILHDENERFHDLGLSVQTQRRGDDFVSFYGRPDGSQIYTVTDPQGRLLRRYRRFPDGREVVLIDNAYDGGVRNYDEDIVDLPDVPPGVPMSEYNVDADANEQVLYDTLMAPPVAPLPQRYTLDQVLYSPALRARVRSVDLNTLNFDTGSWIVAPGQVDKLAHLADAINKAVSRNPNEVFLVEGYTDAVGNPTDNLSLSDRRAQTVATLLTQEFHVPPENLTTQGYGQQYPKEQTNGPSRINRRVTVQRITPLLAEAGQAPPR